MEIFTISGPPVDGVELLGPLGAASPKEQACAQQVAGTFAVGAVATAGSVPLGLFGVYKTLKSGNRAAGVTALIGTAILWAVGRRFLVNAAGRFQTCKGA